MENKKRLFLAWINEIDENDPRLFKSHCLRKYICLVRGDSLEELITNYCESTGLKREDFNLCYYPDKTDRFEFYRYKDQLPVHFAKIYEEFEYQAPLRVDIVDGLGIRINPFVEEDY